MPTSHGAASPPKKVSFRWAAGEGGMLDEGSGAPQPLALCPPHQGTQPGQHNSFSQVMARVEVGVMEDKVLAAQSPPGVGRGDLCQQE